VTLPGQLSEPIEQISDQRGNVLAVILRTADVYPSATDFVTPPDANFQVGFIVYEANGVVQRHTHRPIEREIVGTSEVLLVRKGSCVVELFDDERRSVTTRELRPGDVILLIAGGHGLHMLEDTVLLEVKQGPYTGMDEKERF
jgi:quercetin dioxygenase-like cupin family protein